MNIKNDISFLMDSILNLSDAYKTEASDPDLEFKVTMLNINLGHNKELMDKCRTLKEYAIYVDRVRTHSKEMQEHL